MSRLSSKTLAHLRNTLGPYNVRPMGVLLFTDPLYPDNIDTFQITLTTTEIGLTRTGVIPFVVNYVGKSAREVAIQLSNSPFRITVKSIAQIENLRQGELLVSGANIPTGFNFFDRGGHNSVIVRSKRWTVDFNKLSAMTIKAPYPEGSSLPWWPLVGYGKFIQRLNGITYHFDIPEYNTQTWSPNFGRPFVDVEGEDVDFIGAKIIQLAKSPVLFSNNNIVFTSDDGQRVFPSSVIQDVDTMNGIVYLREGVQLPEDAIVFYTYLEKNLMYRHINANGHFSQNPFILDKYILLYALPVKSSGGINRSRGIYHVVGDSIPDAINSINNASATEPIAILGAISVRPSVNKADINITDTRSFGGGLRTDGLGVATEKKFKESQYFFDIGREEGIPYPGGGAIVIDLPKQLKEVMTLAEIRERSRKFVAAGVYSILELSDQSIEISSYNTDISECKYNFEVANTGFGTGIYGGTGSAASWIDHALVLPDNIYSGYTPNDIKEPAPILDNILRLPAGSRYYQKYLRSSVPPVFTWEERTEGGLWEPKTYTDERDVAANTLIAGRVTLDAQYGYKEVRDFSGFAPFRTDKTTRFYHHMATTVAQYAVDVDFLAGTGADGIYSTVTGYTQDVFTTVLTAVGTGSPLYLENIPGAEPLFRPLMENYDVLDRTNLLEDQGMLDRHVLFLFDSLESNAASTPLRWPRVYDALTEQFVSFHSGEYNAMDDIHALATFARHKMNQHASGSHTSSLEVSTSARTSHSGAFKLADSVEDLADGQSIDRRTDIRPPLYSGANHVAIPNFSGGGLAEIDPLINNTFRDSEYIRAYAALYACQGGPTSTQYVHGFSIPTTVSPLPVAFSGIALATYYFDSFFNNPVKDQEPVPETWLHTYNRVSDLASRHLVNVTEAFDNLYYGNTEWAGWSGYQPNKTASLYTGAGYDFNFTGDLGFAQPSVWPDGIVGTIDSNMTRAVSGINENMAIVSRYIRVQSNKGGITPPGYVNAVRSMLWLPTHAAKQDELFGNYSATQYPDIFEVGMEAVLKGSVSEDGIVTEGAGFAHSPAPFSGAVPSDLFKACADAITYYRLTGNAQKENKWRGLAEGLYRTTTGLYNKPGGYPFSSLFSPANAPGDVGSALMGGLLPLLRTMTGSFTLAETNVLTGAVVSRFA